MLIDVRTYEVKAGTLKAHMDLYAEYGKGPQSKHLGTPLAYLKTETGNPNEYVHMWVYKDAGHREACRARKAAAQAAAKRAAATNCRDG